MRSLYKNYTKFRSCGVVFFKNMTSIQGHSYKAINNIKECERGISYEQDQTS